MKNEKRPLGGGFLGRLVRWARLYRNTDLAYELTRGTYAWRLEPLLHEFNTYLEGRGGRPDYRVEQGGLPFSADGLYTTHTPVFQEDERFMKAYAAGRATRSWGDLDLAWRAHVVAWAARVCSDLPGDFVECGTNRGGYARLIADLVDFEAVDKHFYLVDSYEGLDPELVTHREKELGAPIHAYDPCYENVEQTFSAWDRVVPIKGYIPNILPEVPVKQVALLLIDLNCAEPEVAALEHFEHMLVDGAMVVLDDYCYGGYHVVQQEAMDRFAAERDWPLLALPTGQGVLIKTPRETSRG